MIAWALKAVGVRRRITALALALVLFGLTGLGSGLGIQYVVNSYRSTDYWVTYYSVEPIKAEFLLGTHPVFKSVAVWRTPTDAAWFDRIWCTADKGVIAAMTIRIDSPGFGLRELSLPRTVGMSDDEGNVLEGGQAGYWMWGGNIPRDEAKCFLEPRLKIFPSPLVVRDVPMPSSGEFWFREVPSE